MNDREKVIEEFENCIKTVDALHCIECTYKEAQCMLTCKPLAKDILALLKEQEAVKSQDAEMLIVHNGGAEEYVKDIESIVLLAHKDYDIVYCGKFAEGR